MKMRFVRFLLCAAAIVAALVSCEKEEETPKDLPHLLGQLYFTTEVPRFVGYGYEQDVKVSGAYHPDVVKRPDGTYPDSLGYYFTDPFTAQNDTVKRFEDPVDKKVVYHFKVTQDTLATFGLNAFAFAPGHYSSSCTAYITVVRPGYGDDKSIRGFDTSTESVPLHGRQYYVVEHNGVQWTRQNYSDEKSGTSYCGSEIMNEIFGRYYTWEQASKICPSGWRLPSSAEFDALVEEYGGVAALMSDVYFNGSKPKDKMWRYWPEVGSITDESKLSLFPTGYAVKTDTDYQFYDLQVKSVVWTSDSDDDTGKAIARYIQEDSNILYSGWYDQHTFAASVRCVRDVLHP